MRKRLLTLALVLTAFIMALAVRADGPTNPTPGHPGTSVATATAGPIDPTPGHSGGQSVSASEIWTILRTSFNL
jgi:hypothetical protein